MQKPVIGIVGNVMTIDKGSFLGLERAYLNESYIKAVLEAGGIPIVLPIIDDLSLVSTQIACCDGIILSGGQDIHPMFYSEQQHKHLGDVDSKVDRYQLEVARTAIENDTPLLGICKGMQIMNVATGGSLYQDLEEMNKPLLKHLQSGKTYETAHSISIENNSTMFELFGQSLDVNSYHHQAIKQLGDGLKVTALSDDGVIEAVEMNNKRLVMGVQWHPELMALKNDKILRLFKLLIERANEFSISGI